MESNLQSFFTLIIFDESFKPQNSYIVNQNTVEGAWNKWWSDYQKRKSAWVSRDDRQFLSEREVQYSQYDYLKKLFNKFRIKWSAEQEILQYQTIISIQETSHSHWKKNKKEEFHKVTAKTLLMSQHSRPDTQLVVGFCYTRI